MVASSGSGSAEEHENALPSAPRSEVWAADETETTEEAEAARFAASIANGGDCPTLSPAKALLPLPPLCRPGAAAGAPIAASAAAPGISDKDDIDLNDGCDAPIPLSKPPAPIPALTAVAGPGAVANNAVATSAPPRRAAGGNTDSDDTDEDTEYSDQQAELALPLPAPGFLLETTTSTGDGASPAGFDGDTIGSTSEAAAMAAAVSAAAAAAATNSAAAAAAVATALLPPPPRSFGGV